FLFFIALGGLISAMTVFVAQAAWRGWTNSVRSLLKGELLKGDLTSALKGKPPQALRPLIKDLRKLVQEYQSQRPAREGFDQSWSAKSLKDILQRELRGDEILIVSNREPYIHVRRGDK